MAWPEIVVHDSATITPFLAGSAKAHFSCMADVALDHRRMAFRKNGMTVVPLAGDRARVKVEISEPTIYAGPFFLHFGHFISESLHRLWPRLTMPEWVGAKVAYHAFSLTPLPTYVLDALSLYGVEVDDLIPIRATTRFQRLCVAPQVRQMMGPTLAPEYQGLLDPVLDERFPLSSVRRRLYISRLHHQHTGSYFGETYVEAALEAQGFEIVYPERHTLPQMIAMFRSSDLAVFAEGSALHILELCGTRTPDAFVIGRRSGSVARFAPLLSAVCTRSMTSDHWLANYGSDPNPSKHSGLLDLPAVLADLWRFAGLKPLRHDLTAIWAAVERDVERAGLSVEVLELIRRKPAVRHVHA